MACFARCGDIAIRREAATLVQPTVIGDDQRRQTAKASHLVRHVALFGTVATNIEVRLEGGGTCFGEVAEPLGQRSLPIALTVIVRAV